MGLMNIGSGISGIAGLGSGLAQNFFGSKRDGAKSTLSLQTFLGQLNARGGLYRPTLFMVMVTPKDRNRFYKKIPPVQAAGEPLEIDIDVPERPIMMLCNSAALPGAQIITSDYRRQGYGTFDRRPFGIQVTDIPLTFFIDNDGLVLSFFNSWINNIVNLDTGKGEHHDDFHDKQLFEIGYRDDYLCTIDIFCLRGDLSHDKSKGNAIGQAAAMEQSVIHYQLHEAFPIQVGDITVAWAETDSFSLLPIQFTFRSYTVDTLKDQKKKHKGKHPMGPRAFSMAEKIGLIAGAAGQIGSLQGASKQSIATNAINILNNRQIMSTTGGLF